MTYITSNDSALVHLLGNEDVFSFCGISLTSEGADQCYCFPTTACRLTVALAWEAMILSDVSSTVTRFA